MGIASPNKPLSETGLRHGGADALDPAGDPEAAPFVGIEPPPLVAPPKHRPRINCANVGRTAAVVALAISAAALAGWIFGIGTLHRPWHAQAQLRANTALATALLATACLLVSAALRRRDAAARVAPSSREFDVRERLGVALAALAAAIAAVTLAEYTLGVNLGIDQLFAHEPGPAVAAHPGRPSQGSMVMAGFAAGAIVLAAQRRGRAAKASQALALAVMSIALVTVLNHAYGASVLIPVKTRSAVSLAAAVALFAIGFAVLCLRPYDGWMRIVTGQGAGSEIVRRLVPAIALGVPAIGLLAVLGERWGAYGEQYGMALFAMVALTLTITAVLASAVRVNRYETQQAVAETRRRRVRAMLDNLVAHSNSVIVVEDAQGRFVIVNQAFERLHGVSAADLIGRKVEDCERFFAPEDVARIQRLRQRVREERRAFVEEVTFGEGAKAATALAQVFPIVGARGEPVGFGAITTDITDRIRSERRTKRLNNELQRESRRAREAVAELEGFAHTVSHDLRSPLRAIDGFSQLVESDYGESLDERGRRFLRAIRAGVKDMGDLIDGLLEFSRLGRAELSTDELDMTALARRANDELAVEREGRTVHVRIEDLPPAIADRRLIGAVFANLLSNAHKYTRDREVAEIDVGAIGSANTRPATYFVRDNGVGFEMEYAEKIFGVFERLHRSEDYEGSGVGLATVQRIVRRHGGRIWAQSEPGVGTTMFFRIGENVDEERR